MPVCNSCSTDKIIKLLDAGIQPVTNRFRRDKDPDDSFYSLVVNQCCHCGLIQISDPVSIKEVIPRFDWITYSEPEEHLDNLVEKLISLEGIDRGSIICGITFKDDSILYRFFRHGFSNIWRMGKNSDLEIDYSLAGLETIQERINPEVVKKIVAKRGLADLVIVRHILEHAYDTKRFIAGIKELVKPRGYMIFEVPDCREALDSCDYTTLWEEHILYFTPQTFKRTLVDNSLSLVSFKSYPNAFEDSLVAITRLTEKKESIPVSDQAVNREIDRAKKFSHQFPEHAKKIKEFLFNLRKEKGKIAVFGAGHFACTFISLFDLEDLIDFCVDDNPNKKGLYLAGTQLPIYVSSDLIDKDVRCCLLTLNPINEDKVINKNSSFVDKGGLFLSIFPASKRAIHNYF